jgi:cell division protein FtsI/penicillin-binding protein 2
MLRGIAWVVFLTIVSPFGLLFFPASSSALPIRDEAPFPVKVVPFKKLRDPFIKPSLLNNGEAGERDLSLNRLEGGKFVVPFKNGLKTIYTLRPSLQAGMKEYFKKNKVPYGVFVAMNPHTGKVLALVEHSSREPRAKNLALRATYPAASIFKLITASAAIEEKQADPNTEIINRHRSRSSRTTLGDAFAASDNRAFSEVALRYLNTKTLMNYANRFKFNQKIPFELPVQVSRIKTEDSREGLANLAAGFGNVGLSPIHAAMIGSAIANDGIMVNPCLIDRVVGTSGKTILECTPKVFARAISPHTALQLRQMMGLTITQGTGHRAFKSAWKEPALRDIEIGGKTGSLTGENPAGKVTWFVGMAPLDDPEVVISALIINRGNNWKVKASNVAKKGFETYFGEKRKVRFASKQG